ncbi:MAG: NAD(+)/NADH kinase [Planctomycetes bacterium]|nr:NAD(+)/NADH kinase [Planctomycetota bacterium]
MMRVALIGSPEKPAAAATMERLLKWLSGRATVVFSEITYESNRALPHAPDVLFVLGGDGTMLAAIRKLGTGQLPIVGVNLGKLGFLAEFTVDQLERGGEFLFQSQPQVTRRAMLNVSSQSQRGQGFQSLAVNDCVIFAGPPFRMIELAIDADGEALTEMRGDGAIVATATGSTAQNLSAGGPILEPTAEAFVVTPICPHALTFRPVVLQSNRRIQLCVQHANDGTTLSVDGIVRGAMQAGDCVQITRYAADCLMVRNPSRSVWYALRRKLMWGQPPNGA